MNSEQKTSLIIPVYNESGNIKDVVLSAYLACANRVDEIIVVDDGSTDGTFRELAEISTHVLNLKIIQLKRNFGQTAAIAAGIDYSTGQRIVTLDGDGQNDPKDIPLILDKLDAGYDVVSGWRKHRHDAFLTRILPSIVANWLISRVTGVYLHDYGCTLKGYRRSIIANLQLAGEMHRFLPAWCVWQGGAIAEVVVHHHARICGSSKYGLGRIFKVLIDLTTLKFFSGYLFKPNYLFSGSAMVLTGIAIISVMGALVDKFGPNMFEKFRIPLLLLSGFSMITAIFLALLGLIAEILVRLYFGVVRQKPYRLINE